LKRCSKHEWSLPANWCEPERHSARGLWHSTDRFEIALRENEIPFEYLVGSNVEHVLGVGLGLVWPINNQAVLAKLEKAFEIYLGTRYQDTMPANLAWNLSEFTIDPKSVNPAGARVGTP